MKQSESLRLVSWGSLRQSSRIRTMPWAASILISLALVFAGIVLVLPLVTVLSQALQKGIGFYIEALTDRESWNAFQLTVLLATLVVPLNTLFGVAAAWLLGKYRFPGRQVLITFIDLPFSISPVVAGLVFVLLFGAQGLLGPWLSVHEVKVIFALPGLWLTSLFVTLPFVARELLPVVEAMGQEQEESALMLGASGWQAFLHVSLPQMKWALFHGVILCNARVMGEFGAISVVSGHIRGETNTLPLLVEILYNEYQFTAAFAVASLLVSLALITLLLKRMAEYVQHRRETL